MTPKQLKRTNDWNCSDIVFSIEHDPESSQVWIGSSDFGVYELEVAKEKPERLAFEGDGHTSYVTGMVRVGRTLVTGSYDGALIWWDVDSRKQVRRIAAHDRWIRQVIASPNSSHIISVADDMQCKVWNAATGESVAAFCDHQPMTPHHFPSMLYVVAASPDGQLLATGDRVGHVAIRDAKTFEKVSELETPVMYTWDPTARRHSIGGIRSLAFSPDSAQLAIGGIGKIGNIDHLQGPARLEVFDVATCNRILELEDNNKKGLIEQIVWSPDQSWILTAGGDNDGFLTIYNAKSGELIHQDGQSGHIHGLAHDKDFTNIYVASHERVTRWTMSQA